VIGIGVLRANAHDCYGLHICDSVCDGYIPMLHASLIKFASYTSYLL
jgi:hypothetical protein